MKVIPPLDLTSGSRITSSTVAEPSPGETPWTSGSAYSVGDTVIRTSTHKTYQCILAITAASAASSVAPEASIAQAIPNWSEIGPTNKYAMFDLLRNSGTTATSSITIVITPGQRTDAIGFVGLSGVRSVTIIGTSTIGGGVVYTKTETLNGRTPLGWYDYFFDPLTTKDSTVYFNIPPYVDTVYTITFNGNTSISVGSVVIGSAEFIGIIQTKPTSDVLNFSSVTRDVFGNATMVPRRNVPKTSQSLFLEKKYLARVLSIRDSLNATPALWCGLEDTADQPYFEALQIMGFYRNFSIDLDNPIGVYISLELEEV